jgi:ATP-binding cassette subfamily A (ABC1) protein 3
LFAHYAKKEINAGCAHLGALPQGPHQFTCTGQYVLNGFLTMQRFLHDWIMVDTGATETGLFVAEHGVKFAPFPSKPYDAEGFYGIMNRTYKFNRHLNPSAKVIHYLTPSLYPFVSLLEFLALFLTLGMLYPCASMISYIAQERELGQKEFLKMMGVREWEIGCSWFCSFSLLHLVTASFLAHFSSKLFAHSDPTILWVFWQCAFLAFSVFSCLVPSMIAAKAKTSTRTVMVGLMLILAGYFMTQAVHMQDGDGMWLRILCLHPVAAFSYGIQEIGRVEDAGVGATIHSYNHTDSPSGFTLLLALQFLVGDCFLWTIVSWYFNRVIPSTEHAQALSYSFFLEPTFWFPSCRRESVVSQEVSLGGPTAKIDDNIPSEPVSEALRQQAQDGKSVEIHSLRKVFPTVNGSCVAAVDCLNLSLYNGQITCLLGHNGSGKSTTINMLTGAVTPTDGFTVVAGKHSMTEMPEIRASLGACLQHNDYLFPRLTVQEHIHFFGRLKGIYCTLSKQYADEKVDKAMHDVGLSEKSDCLAMHLSGGMQRKLCLAIAFCGDSKLVLLDEPTSGMAS